MFRSESQQTIPTNLYWRNHAISKTYRKNNNGGAALIGLTLLSQPAQAIPSTFSFGAGDSGLTTVTKTVNGVILTANNFSPTPTTVADSDGLCFAGTGTGFCPDLNSLNLSFSAPVQLISYRVGFVGDGNASASLTFTDGINSSVETNFDANSIPVTNFSTQFSVAANQLIGVTATGLSGTGTLQIRELTVEQATPVPLESDAFPVIAATIFMGGATWWKRRSVKIQQK